MNLKFRKKKILLILIVKQFNSIIINKKLKKINWKLIVLTNFKIKMQINLIQKIKRNKINNQENQKQMI